MLFRSPKLPSFSESPPPLLSHELVVATEDDVKPDAPLTRPASHRHHLLLVLHGEGQYRDSSVSLPLTAGSGVVIPEGRDWTLSTDSACRCIAVAYLGPSDNASVAPLRDGAGRLRELLQWVLVERRSDFPGADRYRASLLELAVQEASRLASDDSGMLEKKLRAYVLDHISDSITLDDLARHVGMGRFHLCRKYRDLTGDTPMVTVRAIRMERAGELIRTTQLPLAKIAIQVGLRSEQHLSRLLKAHFGVGIRELRANSLP